MKIEPKQLQMILYQTEDGKAQVDVQFRGETAWLSLDQMAELFDRDNSVISKHIKNIFGEEELEKESVVAKFATTAADGKTYQVDYYNLDVIISVGYRVKSLRGTQFRIWATQRLREYIIKGFTLDDERLKGSGGDNYWKELLDRIRDIRSSEKALYRQVLDLYATSVDYDPNSPETVKFFKIVQNKLHYATNKQTAAELIHSRVDSAKDFMGLTTFVGAMPTRKDVVIAKNYLTEEELFVLNRLVSAFFDLAEIRAQEHKLMKMRDWVNELNKFAQIYGKGILENSGTISHKEAKSKAIKEYRNYQARTLSPVEKEYLASIRVLQKNIEKKIKK